MKLVFRTHAIKRMFQRRITEEDVSSVLKEGEVIEEYPDDLPYPSRLVLGWSQDRPVHVVAAEDKEAGETIIVTAYEPDAEKWEADFKRRKQ